MAIIRPPTLCMLSTKGPPGCLESSCGVPRLTPILREATWGPGAKRPLLWVALAPFQGQGRRHLPLSQLHPESLK